MHPYRAFRRCRYINFTPLYINTFLLHLDFTLHMISTNFPSIFNRINLSSGMSALRYAPGKSKFSTSLPSCASMMILANKYSRGMVSEDVSSLVMYYIWGCPSAHVLPFSYTLRFILLCLFPSILLYTMILWGCRGTLPPLNSCVILQLFIFLIHGCHRSLYMIFDVLLGRNLCECHTQG